MKPQDSLNESTQEIAARIAKDHPSWTKIPEGPQPLPKFPNPSKAPTFGASDWTGFMWLPSFRESFDYLVMAGHKDLAYKFLEAVMIYGTEGVDITDDPLVAVAMAQAKRVIDKYRNKFKKDKKAQ